MVFDYIIVAIALLGALMALFLPPVLTYAVVLVLCFNVTIFCYSRFKLNAKSIMPLFNGTAETTDAPRILIAFSIALFGAMSLAYITRSYLAIEPANLPT